MKTTLFALTLLFSLTTLGHAAKGDKSKGDRKAQREAIEALKPFDKNGNKTIDGDEIAAVNKALADAPSGPLAALDKNKDGKLDDSELKAMRSRGAIVEIVKELDKDGNKKLEGPELEALKKKFEADPKGTLSSLDQNANGKLEDSEITTLTDRLNRRAEGGARGKKSKQPEAPATPAAPKPAAKEGEEIKKGEPTTK